MPTPPRRASSSKTRTSRSARPSSPPNRVDPGWLHEALAGFTLRAMRDHAEGKLDVGALADDYAARIPGAGEDDPEPAVLLARIYAHIGHRLPLVKRLEKRLEGREKSAGIGSDIAALCAQLYLRNRDLFGEASKLFVQAAIEKRRAAHAADDTPPPDFSGSGGYTATGATMAPEGNTP